MKGRIIVKFKVKFKVNRFLSDIKSNLLNIKTQLIHSFDTLENEIFSGDTNVLVIRSGISDSEINIMLYAQKDMFDSVEISEDSIRFDSKIMVDHFLLYDFDAITEEKCDDFDDFYYDNELEKKSMKEIGLFIKECYEESSFKVDIPFYYSVLDEDDILNLNTGKWDNIEDVILD